MVSVVPSIIPILTANAVAANQVKRKNKSLNNKEKKLKNSPLNNKINCRVFLNNGKVIEGHYEGNWYEDNSDEEGIWIKTDNGTEEINSKDYDRIEYYHKKTVNEAYIKAEKGNIYYTKNSDMFLSMVKSIFICKNIPVRVYYDTIKQIYVFGNAFDYIHADLATGMKYYSKIYGADEMRANVSYLKQNCALFQVLPDDNFKAYDMGDGYSSGWFLKLDDLIFACREKEYTKVRDNVPLFKDHIGEWMDVQYYLSKKNNINESAENNTDEKLNSKNNCKIILKDGKIIYGHLLSVNENYVYINSNNGNRIKKDNIKELYMYYDCEVITKNGKMIYGNFVGDFGDHKLHLNDSFNRKGWAIKDEMIEKINYKKVIKHTFDTDTLNEAVAPKLNDNFWKWFGNSKVVDEQGKPLVVYHGSSKLFNTFKQMKSKSGQLGADLGFWFTDNENIAKQFSNNSFVLDTDKKAYNEYIKSNEYNNKIKELEKKNEITLEDRIKLYKDIVDKDDITNDELEYLKNIPLIKIENIKDKKYRAVFQIYNMNLNHYKEDLKALNNEIKRYFSKNKDKPTVYNCYLSIQNPLVVKGEDIGVSWQRYSVISSAIDEGYDGVIIINGDTGAGLSNEYIVFNPNQIKSVNNNGEWSMTSNNINESVEDKITFEPTDDTFVIGGKEFQDEGCDVYYIIINNAKVGMLALKKLYNGNIEIAGLEFGEPYRNKGYGKQVVKMLKDNYGKIYVRSIPDAKGFWDKQGHKSSWNDDSGTFDGMLDESFEDKILYIIRGVPGSGKSTLAHKLTDNVVEADQYFYDDEGNYNWSADKLNQAHNWCFYTVKKYMEEGKNKIAVANTFVKNKDYKRYVELAKEFGYKVDIRTCTGNYQNIHNVPDETVEKMRSKFQETPLNEELIHMEKSNYDDYYAVILKNPSKKELRDNNLRRSRIINFANDIWLFFDSMQWIHEEVLDEYAKQYGKAKNSGFYDYDKNQFVFIHSVDDKDNEEQVFKKYEIEDKKWLLSHPYIVNVFGNNINVKVIDEYWNSPWDIEELNESAENDKTLRDYAVKLANICLDALVKTKYETRIAKDQVQINVDKAFKKAVPMLKNSPYEYFLLLVNEKDEPKPFFGKTVDKKYGLITFPIFSSNPSDLAFSLLFKHESTLNELYSTYSGDELKLKMHEYMTKYLKKGLEKSLSNDKSEYLDILIHECTHLLDDVRRTKTYKSKKQNLKDDKGIEDYYNSSEEQNAYYQETVSIFDEYAENKLVGYKTFDIFWDDFIRQYRGEYNMLNDKNKRKLKKRAYAYWYVYMKD